MRILVVEGNPTDRAHLRRLLSRFPERHVIDEATSGTLALDQLGRERYRCMLLGNELADMTATQLLGSLGERAAHTPPVVLLCDGDDEKALRQYLEAGAQDYLLKSEVSVAALAHALRRAIDRQRGPLSAPDLSIQDALTSLHNAAFFRQYFTKAIERATRQGRRIGVLLVDLEELRTVKEAHGRDAADTMLRELAVRLNGAVRKSDLVARLGADEFAVLAEDILREDDLRALADKIGNALGRTFVAGKVSIQVAIRIRTAAFPAESAARTHAQTDLLAATDFAIYRPETPVGAYGTAQADATRWGDREHQQRVRHRLAETVRLQPFHLHYQPRYRAQTQGLEALEGLMRWDDAELGPVPPSAFIPICERNGMISLLGRVAVERASEDWRRHLDRVATDLPLKVSLNLSPAQLLDDEFLMCLENEAEARSSLRGRLQVEISDKAGVQNSKRCVRALEELVSVGIAVAIDDFGAGSTSVAQLTSMPVSGVILDAALTDGIAPDTSQARRVGALISMANALGIAVTAKCIETAAQLQCLIALGCHHAQGNALSSPLAPDELAYVLRGAGTTAS